MSYHNLQQNALAVLEEMSGCVTNMPDQKGIVICPKPRRVRVLQNVPVRPMKWHWITQQGDGSDSRAGAELLDIIYRESYGEEQQYAANQVASSPPFFVGSPPVRSANPLIQDAQFGCAKLTPPPSTSANILSSSSSSAAASALLSPSAASRKGERVRMKLGLKPAAVRVEGFDCHVRAVA